MRTFSLVACACLLLGCQGGETTTASAGEALSGNNGDPQEAIKHPPVLKWTHADDAIIAPIWSGDDDHGSLYMPQWRGAATGIEEYVWAPPDGDCRGFKGTVRVDWDSSQNTVRIVSKYRNLPKKPKVRRTTGVDYEPNPFHQFPKDFDDGVYRLWIIMGGKGIPATLYYDPSTLDLLGSQYEFPNGPPNNGAVIPVTVPFFQLTGSASFEPDDNGFAVHDYTIPYDHLQVESGDFSVAKISFVPFNLCLGQPAAPARGQARPIVSPWLAPGIGPSWREVLHGGLTFDVQLENPKDATAAGGNLPYIFGGVAFVGMPAFQGGVPNGYRFSLSSQIQNVAPINRPVPGGNGLGCAPYVNEPHITAPNHCGQ